MGERVAVGARYFRLEPTRLTVGECWRLSLDLGAFVWLLGTKLGLAGWNSAHSVACATTWPAIDPADVPLDVAGRMDEHILTLEDEGFRQVAHGRLPMLERHRVNHTVLMLSADRVVGAAVVDHVDGLSVQSFATLTSRFTDRTYGVTLGCPERLDMGPGATRDYRPGLPTADLYRRHRDNLNDWESAGRLAVPFAPEDAVRVAVELDNRSVDHLADRGVLVELTDDEIEDRREQHGEEAG